jgi:hypothetical protein
MVFLETAELRAKNRQDITIKFWQENIDKIIELNDKILLKCKGKVKHEKMEEVVENVYKKFDDKRKIEEARKADEQEMEELKQLEVKIKKSKK